MAAVSTVLDAEPVVLEDLDFEVSCHAQGGECPHPARWAYHWSCGCVSLLCQGHHEKAQALIRDVNATFYCDDVHMRIMHVVSVTSIKGKP